MGETLESPGLQQLVGDAAARDGLQVALQRGLTATKVPVDPLAVVVREEGENDVIVDGQRQDHSQDMELGAETRGLKGDVHDPLVLAGGGVLVGPQLMLHVIGSEEGVSLGGGVEDPVVGGVGELGVLMVVGVGGGCDVPLCEEGDGGEGFEERIRLGIRDLDGGGFVEVGEDAPLGGGRLVFELLPEGRRQEGGGRGEAL